MNRFSIAVVFGTSVFLYSNLAQAQFGGVQVRVGGYGTGVRVGNFSYGNGLYGNYGNGYGYGNGFANPYYGNYSSGYGSYQNRGYYNNGFGYNNYPNAGYRYVAPQYYSVPTRSYPIRRYRYR